MPLVPVLLAALAALLAWAGAGFSADPLWTLAFLPSTLWLLAGLDRRPLWPRLGFLGLVALAGAVTAQGNLEIGLGVMGLTLLAWDSAGLLHWRGDKRELQRVLVRGLVRSGAVAGIGIALGLAASRLRLAFPFWGLMGLMALVWLALWAWSRGVQGRGGAAKGNRSGSPSMK